MSFVAPCFVFEPKSKSVLLKRYYIYLDMVRWAYADIDFPRLCGSSLRRSSYVPSSSM